MSEQVRFQIAWVIFNLIGIGLFLKIASLSWIEPELANEPGASAGDAFVWFLTAVPLLALFALGHLIAACAALTKSWRGRKAQPGLILLPTIALWIGAAWFDNLHHGI